MTAAPDTHEARLAPAGLHALRRQRNTRRRNIVERAARFDRAALLTLLGRALVPLVIPALYVLAVTRHNAYVIGITNLDYFPQVDWALRLQWGAWADWVSWKWPAGFALLLKLGMALGIDTERFGQVLSMLGGALGLIATYGLGRLVGGGVLFALASQAFVALNARYLFFGGFEGTDMLAAGLQSCSLTALVLGLASPGRSTPWLVAAGLAAGLAYPIRYTSAITLGAGLVVLAARALAQRDQRTVSPVGLYVGAAALAALPQWLPTWAVTGSPLSIDQGQNVWFDVFQKADYVTEWNDAPPGITTWGVFMLDPGRFAGHWWGNFQSFWLAPDAQFLATPLGLVGPIGLAYLVVRGRDVSPWVRTALLTFVVVHAATLSIMHLDRRFLMIMAPPFTVGAVFLFAHTFGGEGMIRGARIPTLPVLAGLGLLAAVPSAWQYVADQPRLPDQVVLASDALRGAGLQRPDEVLSTELELHDLGDVTRQRYPQAYWVAPGHESLGTLLDDARTKGFRFLVYGPAGWRSYPRLTDLADPNLRPMGLIPIYSEPLKHHLAIYRVAPEILPPPQVFVQFANGIVLDGVRVTAARRAGIPSGWNVGVYLRWDPQILITRSYKVFIHLVDEQGRLVAQDDAIPAVWTFPTTAWKPGQALIDYHAVVVPDPIAPQITIVAGFYDPESGQRLARLDATGQPVDDKASVGRLTLEGGTPRFRPAS